MGSLLVKERDRRQILPPYIPNLSELLNMYCLKNHPKTYGFMIYHIISEICRRALPRVIVIIII